MKDKIVFADTISQIEWSPDDNFILAVISKKNQLQVKCVNPVEGLFDTL